MGLSKWESMLAFEINHVFLEQVNTLAAKAAARQSLATDPRCIIGGLYTSAHHYRKASAIGNRQAAYSVRPQLLWPNTAYMPADQYAAGFYNYPAATAAYYGGNRLLWPNSSSLPAY